MKRRSKRPPTQQKKQWYAVAHGRAVGLFRSWDECEKQVKCFSGSKYKGFVTLAEAERWLDSEIKMKDFMSNVEKARIIYGI